MRVPSYRKHSSGQARVTLARRDYLLGPHGSKESKREYNRLIAEFLSADRSPAFGLKSAELTIVDLIHAYKKHCIRYYGLGPTSERHRIKIGLRAVRILYSRTVAIAFGPLEYKAVRQYIMDGKNTEPRVKGKLTKAGKKPKPVRRPSRQYLNALMKRVRRMFGWAAGEGMIPAAIPDAFAKVDPLKAGRCKAPERERVKPVADAVVDATLPHLSSVVADMVRFQRATGARPGEVCSLKPSMVDRSHEVWEINLDQHKTAWRGKKRVVYVGPKAQAILSPYLLREADEYCFKPKQSERKRLQVLHDERTTPINIGNRPGHRTSGKSKFKRKFRACYFNGTYARAITRVCEREGIPHWAPNQLRHSMATQVRKSDGLEAAAIILGHSEVGVTQVYAEADRAKAVEIVRRIG